MNRFLLTALVLAFGLSVATPANAAFQVTLSAGASSTTIVDNGVGDDDGASGVITVDSETVGAYTFRSTFSMTNSPGTGDSAFLIAGTTFISGTGATTISIVATADGFTLPASPPDVYAISGSTSQYQAGTPSGNTATVSYNAFVNADLVGTGSDTIAAPGGNANLGQTTLYTIPSTPYSLSLELKAVLNNGGQNNIDLDGTLELQPTPEPTTLAIWGLGAMGVLVAGRFRRKLV